MTMSDRILRHALDPAKGRSFHNLSAGSSTRTEPSTNSWFTDFLFFVAPVIYRNMLRVAK